MRRLLVLISFALAVMALSFTASATCTAGVGGCSSTDAFAACNAAISVYQPKYTSPLKCIYKAGGAYGYGYVDLCPDSGSCIENWSLNSAFNPCSAIPSVHMYTDGKILQGFTFSQNTQDSSGKWVPCTMMFTPLGAPIWNPYSGVWQTYGMASPSGNPSSATDLGSSGPAAGDWLNSSGASADPQPPAPPQPATDNTNPPAVCGGGSCYDPGSDQYCASAGGQQYCVPGASGRSSAGGCVSGASSVVCAGSPSPPLPPTGGQSPVNDPATDIGSSDNYTTANPVTGAVQTVIVNNYAAPGITTGSTQQAGDYGPSVSSGSGSSPAPSSSTSGNGSASGGQDCHSPPVCSGDPVTCMVVKQTWDDRCSQRWDEDANGQPNWTKVQDSDGAAYASSAASLSSVTGTVGDGRAQGDPGITDLSGLDTSGLGAGNSCPPLPTFTWNGQTITLGNQDLFCRFLALIRGVILLGAAFTSARILASGGKG